MKNKLQLLYVILIFGVILSSMLNAQTATAPSGAGTSGDPYQITSLDNLYWMSQNTNLTGKYYKLMNDIDASSTSTWDDGDGGIAEGFVPIGSSSSPFRGYFDGQNYTISGLDIDRGTDNIGLFGYTSGVAEISNVRSVTVSITGSHYVGGLVGSAHGNLITNCKVTGSITGYDYTGGLIGVNSSNTVTNSYSKASVSGEDYVGGLIGWEYNSTISANYATGDVSSSSDNAGGLIGYAEASTISNCYSKGDVTRSTGTSTYFGALVGQVSSENGATAVSYSYSTGSVYYAFSPDATDKGFVGYDNTTGGTNTYTNNFWDSEASNQSTATGATSKTTAEMKNSATFTSAGWDFVTETTNGSNDYWDDDISEAINGGYMPLAWQDGTDGVLNGTPSGTGTSGDPYLIATLDNLIWITQNSDRWDEYFKQTAPINASSTSTLNSGAGLVPIGNSTTKFTGFYVGQNYSISNLTINRPATPYVGLFGYTSGVAEISNVRLVTVSITGSHHTGGIVGLAQGNLITNCNVTGSITGYDYTGGLIGANSSNTVSNSYSKASVSGEDYVGGLIGWEFSSTISANYATGSVTSSSDNAGGLIGYAEASTISNCYSKGDVTRSTGTSTYFGAFVGQVSSENGATAVSYSYSTGSVYYTGTTDPTDKGFAGYDNITGGTNIYTNNLWDNDASNQSTATGATSKTTTEMKDYRTYTAAGWDFNYETTNGSNDYWDDDQLGTVNSYYPILYWQIGANDETYGQPSAGDGSEGNPYEIGTLNNLYWLSKNTGVWDKYFIQTQNIDATLTITWHNGLGLEPIGNSTTSFSGTYNGDDYYIDGLTIDRATENNMGLFGKFDGATINNLTVQNGSINGSVYVGAFAGQANSSGSIQNSYSLSNTIAGDGTVGGIVGSLSSSSITNSKNTSTVSGSINDVGGIAGYLLGTCRNCANEGNITGVSRVGGIAGTSLYGSNIEKTYSIGDIEGTSSVGGFIGKSSADISNSYCKGNVTRTSGATAISFGAFLGEDGSASSSVENCYATGSITYTDATNPTDKGFAANTIGTYSNNFFDSETSSQTTGAGATAKITAEMKTRSTFSDAGWDGNIWNMDAGFNGGYAYLDWQNPGGTPTPVELTSFTANVNENTVVLNWETATEVNNYGFEIERKFVTQIASNLSNDEWENIGFVQGHGNSNSPKYYEFVDENPLPDSAEYRLKQIDTDGGFAYYDETVQVAGYSTTDVYNGTLPLEYNLAQNHPNPFNPSTQISFTIPSAGIVKLNVYNVLGEVVSELVNENLEAGFHQYQFNASNLTSGIYFYSISVNGFTEVKKMNLIK